MTRGECVRGIELAITSALRVRLTWRRVKGCCVAANYKKGVSLCADLLALPRIGALDSPAVPSRSPLPRLRASRFDSLSPGRMKYLINSLRGHRPWPLPLSRCRRRPETGRRRNKSSTKFYPLPALRSPAVRCFFAPPFPTSILLAVIFFTRAPSNRVLQLPTVLFREAVKVRRQSSTVFPDIATSKRERDFCVFPFLIKIFRTFLRSFSVSVIKLRVMQEMIQHSC